MFHQLLAPVANNLFLSFLVGFISILVVLILLGIIIGREMIEYYH